ncbi:Arginine--tRNA ligase [Slackia heliotrinireducens]|uniref:Arginine--tRNA ligase n=1 Tax=Slackia heliotrinireducens (strain ATCC 29202 / DSM 20476 / NCTC 11029 / RHS 1) TaxID=471855 RepID=C7N1E9_SLAHD|nr:arginine--tRNA ligase [Slackia heliotrinireducens]ACV21241.1 arginyl-tRNA synthetase [Slackia heliotrinireducens DSM 20476]VEG98675.1 Arginine--tRNA ligase [Slackia heliotrinireducens]
MQPREDLGRLISAALDLAIASGALALETTPEVTLERPRDEGHGDWACTVALRCAKQAKKNPREVAQTIVDYMPEPDFVEKVEIAGPGFINFYLKHDALQNVVVKVREQKGDYGKGTIPEGMRRVQIEYISSNPTGPMHVGHGRWAALGSAMANVMRHAGYDVFEEFYINDHGVQMDKFGVSIVARYLQQLGQADAAVPEGGYNGLYVNDIAKAIIDRDGDKWVNADEHERMVEFREFGYAYIMDNIRSTCERFGNHFERWQSERELYAPSDDFWFDGRSPVEAILDKLREQGDIYDEDGAVWFRSSAYGDEKDRVLQKSDGAYTYFASDVAYHYLKKMRGFDHLIDIWGADHHGYIARVAAVLAAEGFPGALEVVLGQLVNLFRDGKPVRMSKRTGEMITFEELIDEVGIDATRYWMLDRSSDQPIDFDIEVAKRADDSNPVYYDQYAHARICSLLRNASGHAGEDNLDMDAVATECIPADVDLSVLSAPEELALMRKMSEFGDMIALAARDRAPFRLTHYAYELASLFHSFYANCPVLKAEDEGLKQARLALADATRIVMAITLNLLGISAPQRMFRETEAK